MLDFQIGLTHFETPHAPVPSNPSTVSIHLHPARNRTRTRDGTRTRRGATPANTQPNCAADRTARRCTACVSHEERAPGSDYAPCGKLGRLEEESEAFGEYGKRERTRTCRPCTWNCAPAAASKLYRRIRGLAWLIRGGYRWSIGKRGQSKEGEPVVHNFMGSTV